MRIDEAGLMRIGSQFGEALAERFSRVSLHSVGVQSVTDEYADVYEFEGDALIRVPLLCLGSESALVKVKPKTGSTAIIAYVDGDITRPVFVSVTEVDEIDIAVGESTVEITKDVIKFNGGDVGMVFADKLTKRLNQLKDEISQLQNKFLSHTHLSAAPSTPTSVPTASTPPTTPVVFTEFVDSDYANDKITQ
jgi:hypothetical protein